MKETKGWMRPHDLDRRRENEPFDPVAAGARYGLSRELSLAIWERVCAQAVDGTGQLDLEHAKRRFQLVAARVAARGGRWPYADVGKQTRVDTEQGDGAARGRNADELTALDPGRRTLVEAEASRWEPTEHDLAAAKDEHRLPIPTLDRMERAFGRRFDDVEIHVDSAEVPAGIEAFTRGRHIFFGRGAFAPGGDHGDHVIAHELAHVAQQSRPMTGGVVPTRNALEVDAHDAALNALAGRAASVSLFAPAAAALGFSDGTATRNPSARGSGGSSQSAHGGSSGASSARAPGSGGGAVPRPKPASSAKAPPRPAGAAPATSAAPRRGATGDGLRIPEAPSALTPAAAGRLRTVQAGNQGNAAATTTLPSGQQQTDVGRAAVEEPQAEQDARAQHGVVTDVDDRPPPSPEIEEACARIRQVIRDKRPPDEDKLVEAKPREMAEDAGKQMSAGVEQRAGTVREGYADMQQPPPGSPSSAPVPPTLPPQHAETQSVDAGAAAPDPVNPDDVSLDKDVADQNKEIEGAGMNTEPGKLVKDGPIGDAHGGVDELSGIAKTDPDKVIADQAKAIGKAKGDMHALQQAADKALADARAGTVDQMGKHTTGVKGSEEQQRAQAGEKMKGIFDRTQKAVDGLLQPLAGKAVARWDAGVAQLSTEFEASLASVKRQIDERHSGAFGLVTSFTDWATGLPIEITMQYDIAEAKFADGATSLIRDISRDVNAVVEDCKKLIQLARKDIDEFVKSLPASLQTWAQGEAAKLNQQLDGLDKRVDQTQKGINKDLINRANGAVQEVRERVHELREKAKGAIAKVAAAIAEFVKDPFKAIVNGLLRILGIPPDSFWSMVDRLGDVVGAIAKDPVKFGKTLISGAAQGFKQFFEHFPTHLKEILMGWLFGTMGTAGVPMPTDFSGPGIMPTVLGILGIDSGMILSMLGVDLSDPAEMAEAQHEISGVLSGDPHALVALFRDHFDAASLIPMIREAAMSFLVQALLMQVAPRIAAMLVPGGAILQAVEAIFKVLLWVIMNAARIFTLIESLVATAGQAVAGNVAGVAAGVESSLVQIIVLVIDFLASYIGLGGIGAKLKGVIMKVSGKLKTVLKKVIDAIAKRAKAKAKAKHGQDKPAASKKPDGDVSSPAHPSKPDDRDPQKAKDDAKDPRNHKPDPDDKDPRNHKPDPDDKDPRNRKPDADADPKKRKDDDEHDPKKRKDDDEKKKHENDGEARRVARAAANRGWAAARNATAREVRSKPELKSILSREEHSTPKARVSLEVEDRGTSWAVDADAKVGSAKASNTEGHGWIAHGDGNQRWYADRDLSAFNNKLIEEGFQKLDRDPNSRGGDDAPDDRALYDRKVQQGKQVVEGMQQRLNAEIRGMKADIAMEPWSGVKADRLIETTLSVKPNTSSRKKNEPLGDVPKAVETARWPGGEEEITVTKANGELKITNANNASIANLLSDALNVHFRNVRNTAGPQVLNVAHNEIRRLEKSNEDVKKVANDVVGVVEKVGREFRIPNLARLKDVEDAANKRERVEIKLPTWLQSPYLANFKREVTHQRDHQEDQCNKLTVDEWIANLDTYKSKDASWIKNFTEDQQMAALSELHNRFWDEDVIGKQKRQSARENPGAKTQHARDELDNHIEELAQRSGLTRADVLDALRADDEIREKFMGRYGDEAKFRRTHRAGIRALRRDKEWQGMTNPEGKLDVILHNPDQIGGGYGSVLAKLPKAEPSPGQRGHDPAKWKAYLVELKKYVGVAEVNRQFGAFWKERSQHVYQWLKTKYPESGYPLWRMNITLDIVYVVAQPGSNASPSSDEE